MTVPHKAMKVLVGPLQQWELKRLVVVMEDLVEKRAAFLLKHSIVMLI